MAAKRIVLKAGDVFRVKISRDDYCFMQYLMIDPNCLGGDLVRVFWKRYREQDRPSVDEIVSGQVDFYTHVFLKNGIREECFVKYGRSDNLGDLRKVYFANYAVYHYFSDKPSWHVYTVYSDDRNNVRHKELPSAAIDACEGSLGPPSGLVRKIVAGIKGYYNDLADDSLRSRLGKSLKAGLRDMCAEIGFSNAYGECYFKKVGDDCVAILYFKCASWKKGIFRRHILLTCSVGVANLRLYDMFISHTRDGKNDRPKGSIPYETVIANIGQLMPQNCFVDWEITGFTDIAGLCAELKETIVAHAFPFINKLYDFENLTQAIISDEYHMAKMCREILLAEISYMKGDRKAALKHLQDRFGGSREYNYTEHLFNQNFRKLLE